MFEEAFRSLNPFVPKAPVLYPMKTSENLKELEKGCIGNEWANFEMGSTFR